MVHRRLSTPWLRQAHSCNYCGHVHGVTWTRGKVRARIAVVNCVCGRTHYACRSCANSLGVALSGVTLRIAVCARSWNGLLRRARAEGKKEVS